MKSVTGVYLKMAINKEETIRRVNEAIDLLQRLQEGTNSFPERYDFRYHVLKAGTKEDRFSVGPHLPVYFLGPFIDQDIYLWEGVPKKFRPILVYHELAEAGCNDHFAAQVHEVLFAKKYLKNGELEEYALWSANFHPQKSRLTELLKESEEGLLQILDKYWTNKKNK